MTEESQLPASARLAMGGNNPPAQEALREELGLEGGALDRRVTQLQEAAQRVPAELSNDDEAQRLSDFLAQIKAAHKEATGLKAKMKAPLTLLIGMIENYWAYHTGRLERLDQMLRPRLKKWQDAKAEAERREREEEARLAREAQARAAREKAEKERREREAEEATRRAQEEADRKAAAARKAAEDAAKAEAKAKTDAQAEAARKKRETAEKKQREADAAKEREHQAEEKKAAADREAMLARRQSVNATSAAHHAEKQIGGAIKAGRIRGEMGSLATLRQKMAYRIVDEDLIPLRFKKPDDTLIRAAINDGGETAIPGIEIFPETNTTVRG